MHQALLWVSSLGCTRCAWDPCTGSMYGIRVWEQPLARSHCCTELRHAHVTHVCVHSTGGGHFHFEAMSTAALNIPCPPLGGRKHAGIYTQGRTVVSKGSTCFASTRARSKTHQPPPRHLASFLSLSLSTIAHFTCLPVFSLSPSRMGLRLESRDSGCPVHCRAAPPRRAPTLPGPEQMLENHLQVSPAHRSSGDLSAVPLAPSSHGCLPKAQPHATIPAISAVQCPFPSLECKGSQEKSRLESWLCKRRLTGVVFLRAGFRPSPQKTGRAVRAPASSWSGERAGDA